MKIHTLALALFMAIPSAFADNLIDVYHEAQSKDTVLLEAHAQREAAREKISESTAALLPQLNLSGSLTYGMDLTNDLNQTSAGAGVRLDQSLYNGGLWAGLDIVEKSAAKADINYALSQQDLMLRTVTAYFNVLKAQDALEFIQSNQRAVEKQLEQTKQRFAVGLTAITDVHEAEAERDQALASAIAAENTLVNRYEELRQLTGRQHTTLARLDRERFTPVKPALNADEWLRLALDKNLTLHSARMSKDIAKTQIDAAQTEHLPTFGLSASANTKASDQDEFDSFANTASVGVNVALPLYSGGATSSRVKQAQHNYLASSEQLERALRKTQISVRSAYNNTQAGIGSIKAYEQSVISARSALKATEAGYEVGTRTVVDVLNATKKLYSAQQSLAEVRYDFMLSVLSLKQAAGTLVPEDLVAINQGLVAP